jgi:hypothetical protein
VSVNSNELQAGGILNEIASLPHYKKHSLRDLRREFGAKQIDKHAPIICVLLDFSHLFPRNQCSGPLYFERPVEVWADYAHHSKEIAQCIAYFEEEKQNIAFVFQRESKLPSFFTEEGS